MQRCSSRLGGHVRSSAALSKVCHSHWQSLSHPDTVHSDTCKPAAMHHAVSPAAGCALIVQPARHWHRAKQCGLAGPAGHSPAQSQTWRRPNTSQTVVCVLHACKNTDQLPSRLLCAGQREPHSLHLKTTWTCFNTAPFAGFGLLIGSQAERWVSRPTARQPAGAATGKDSNSCRMLGGRATAVSGLLLLFSPVPPIFQDQSASHAKCLKASGTGMALGAKMCPRRDCLRDSVEPETSGGKPTYLSDCLDAPPAWML